MITKRTLSLAGLLVVLLASIPACAASNAFTFLGCVQSDPTQSQNVAVPGYVLNGGVQNILQNNDLLLMVWASNNTDTLIAPPGWTQVSGGPIGNNYSSSDIFYHFVNTASDPSIYSSYNDTPNPWPGGIGRNTGLMCAYRGVNSASAIDAVATNSSSGSSAPTAPSVTTTVDSDLIFTAFGFGGNQTLSAASVASAGVNERDYSTLGPAGLVPSEVNDWLQATHGVTGTKAFAFADAGSHSWSVMTIALKPTGLGPVITPNNGCIYPAGSPILFGGSMANVPNGVLPAPDANGGLISGQSEIIIGLEIKSQGSNCGGGYPTITVTTPGGTSLTNQRDYQWKDTNNTLNIDDTVFTHTWRTGETEYIVSVSCVINEMWGAVTAYNGVDTATPIDNAVYSSRSGASAQGFDNTTSAFTASEDYETLLNFHFAGDKAGTYMPPPPGFTMRGKYIDSEGQWHGIAVSDFQFFPTSAIPAITNQNETKLGEEPRSILIAALKPVSACSAPSVPSSSYGTPKLVQSLAFDNNAVYSEYNGDYISSGSFTSGFALHETGGDFLTMQCESNAYGGGGHSLNIPPTFSAPSDSAGNSWISDLNVGSNDTGYVEYWHATNIGGGLNTITANYAGGSFSDENGAGAGCTVQEWTGMGPRPTVDVANSANSTSSGSLDTGSVSTTHSDDLIIGLMNVATYQDSNHIAVPLISSWPSGGFRSVNQNMTGLTMQVMPVYLAAASTGTYHSTGTSAEADGVYRGWQGGIVAYAPGSAGAKTPTLTPTPTSTPTPALTTFPTPTPAPTPSRVAAALKVTPGSINFGSVRVGASKAKTLTVINSSRKGGPTITFQSPAGNISGSNEFRPVINCTALGPKQTCSATITFSPNVTGATNAIVVLNDNSNNAPQRISITGAGK